MQYTINASSSSMHDYLTPPTGSLVVINDGSVTYLYRPNLTGTNLIGAIATFPYEKYPYSPGVDAMFLVVHESALPIKYNEGFSGVVPLLCCKHGLWCLPKGDCRDMIVDKRMTVIS